MLVVQHNVVVIEKVRFKVVRALNPRMMIEERGQGRRSALLSPNNDETRRLREDICHVLTCTRVVASERLGRIGGQELMQRLAQILARERSVVRAAGEPARGVAVVKGVQYVDLV